jgi:ABC-type dipeptide/oligopeptide/nickel transport system permease subunit
MHPPLAFDRLLPDRWAVAGLVLLGGVVLAPRLAIGGPVLGVNLLGDRLRDALDVRAR